MKVDVRSVQLSLRDATTGVVQYQPDFYGASPGEPGDQPAGNSYPALMPYGLMARPLDPSGQDPNNMSACEGLIIEGPDEGRVMPTTDPRYLSAIPDSGSGGSVLYGIVDDGTNKLVTTVLIAGTGIEGVTAGSLFINVPYGDGSKQHQFVVDLGQAKIRLVHGEGPALELSATGLTCDNIPNVALVGPGGAPIMTDDGRMATFYASVATALTNLGQAVTPPTGYTSTKATA